MVIFELPSLTVIPLPLVPVIVPLLSIPAPAWALIPVLPFITPDDLLLIFIAEEDSLTKIPFSEPEIFPSLFKSPSIDSMLMALPVVDVIFALRTLLIMTCCARVLISRPFSIPETLPWLVTVFTLNPVTETAASFPEEVIVTSLLMTYSASVEKFWGVEVDWSIVLAKATAGGNNNRAGKRLARVLVALLSLKCLLLIYTSI
ncbi:hypothetical protein [Enterobacter roggenkampii]|uniref:hypothetical protein n=1 Tax=Enterobacter roggenkampii TaxID=1812935 RepID=UPI0032B022FD